jgi:hypothetical protein
MEQYYIFDNYNQLNYINSLLITLFLKKSLIYRELLDSPPQINTNNSYQDIYFQEIIKTIIINLKKFNILNANTVSYFKNIIYLNGFSNKDTINSNMHPIFLYDYLLNYLKYQKMELMNIKLLGKIEQMNYITLETDLVDTKIKELIKLNLSGKILNNIPNIICFQLNRKNDNSYIDIQKKISINSIYNFTDKSTKLIWKIHSIICHDSINNIYYSFIKFSKDWLYVNELEPEFIKIVNIKNFEVAIKTKSVMIFYTFSKN